ncbi:MAG: 4Fe-4S binding protein [Dehalococcoidales bacterium]|nr:4Fe-4S binding protein [Dehalococcoidales bacterium]
MAGVKMRTPFGIGFIGGVTVPNEFLRNAQAGCGHMCVQIDYKPNKEQCDAILAETEMVDDSPIPEIYTDPEGKEQLIGHAKPIWTSYGMAGYCYFPGGSGVGHFGLDPRIEAIKPNLSGYYPTQDQWEAQFDKVGKLISESKKLLPENTPLVGIFRGIGATPKGYTYNAKFVEDMGADMVLLNCACPDNTPYDYMYKWYKQGDIPARGKSFYGMLLWRDKMANIIREIKKVVKIPLGVKMSTEVGCLDYVWCCEEFLKAGCDFIETMNCGQITLPPDIYNPKTSPVETQVYNKLTTAFNGPGLLNVNFKDVGIVGHFVPKMGIMSTGGLTDPEHVVQALMLGAHCTNQVTAVEARGRDVIRENVHFLHNFMKQQGYSSVKEIIGIHQPYLKDWDHIWGNSQSVKRFSAVDTSKCVGCGICADRPHATCPEGCCTMENGHVVVHPELCLNCERCVVYCPYGARFMVNA